MSTRFFSGVPFVEARNYTKAAGSNGTVTRVVIHDMEMAESGTTAESCANYFHTTTKEASAHFTIDSNSIVQCVPLDCRAWHAPPNAGSVGLEHAGFVRQTRAQWLDDFGQSMLDLSARLTAWLCKLYGLPAVKLSASDLRAGRKGICGHADVSAAWGQSDHTDPGPNFPWDWYISRVNHYLTGGTPVSEAQPTLNEIQRGILYYDLGPAAVNPLTLLSRTYSMVASLVTGEEDQDKALAAIQALVAGQADTIAAKVVAALPSTGSGSGGSLTVQDVEDAVKAALREGTA